MWVGVSGVVVSSLLPVAVGRLNDLLRGHTKTLLLVLMITTTVFFYWFLLLSYGVLPVTDCESLSDSDTNGDDDDDDVIDKTNDDDNDEDAGGNDDNR